MAELLLELFSEEIPARMQARAAEDLKLLVIEGLKAQGLTVGEAKAFVTPRRLTLMVDGVPAKSPEISEERKGPRVNAPEAAIAGFLKGAGLKSVKDAIIVKDEKKGDFYVARIDRPGRKAADIIGEVVPAVAAKFPWPKSMRWGLGTATWVRPLHSIVCLLDGKVVPFTIGDVGSANITRGHRFLGNAPFVVKDINDYEEKLEKHKVILDPERRKQIIWSQVEAITSSGRFTAVQDVELCEENAGLTESPTVLMGTFDKRFLEMPEVVLLVTMKRHQKCFSVRQGKKFANRFLLVTNLVVKDGGQEIVAGNEKVIAARLSDAKFFWQQDLKKPLDEMASALAGITFHEKLGSQKERVERIAELAFQIAGSVDAVPEDARRAAQLAKADLVSGMVGEFPELQGLMGRYYAEAAGTKPEIARAVELHYKPKGPTDTVPLASQGDAVAIAVALADKLDTLVGFWAIGEKPTGSGDPYQLRRAALGVIRIVLENDLRVPLMDVLMSAAFPIRLKLQDMPELAALDHIAKHEFARKAFDDRKFWSLVRKKYEGKEHIERLVEQDVELAIDLLSFFAERLKVHLRDKGARHDLIDAVFALPGQDDLALIVKRVEALGEFLKTDDGAVLLTGVKRATNIIRDEEKKDKRSYSANADPKLLREPEEKTLYAAIQKVKKDTVAAINVENFAGAMRALAELRAPVDAFFDKVTVNVAEGPDAARLRANRLALLSEIRAATLNVADFSKIAG